MASLELEATATKSSSRDVVTNNSVERERFKKRALAIQREIRAYATSMKVMQRTFIDKRPPCINFEDEERKQLPLINRLENANRFNKKTPKYRQSKGLSSSLPPAKNQILPTDGLRKPQLSKRYARNNRCKNLNHDSTTVYSLQPKAKQRGLAQHQARLDDHQHCLPTRKFEINGNLNEPMVIVNAPLTLSKPTETNVHSRSDSRALLRAHIEQEHPLIGKHGRSQGHVTDGLRNDSLSQIEFNEALFYPNDFEKPQIVAEEEENMKETQRKIKDFLDRTCAESVCSDTETSNFWSTEDEKKRKVSRVYSLNTPYRSKACSTRSSVLGIHHEPKAKKKLGLQLPPMILPPIHTSCVYKPKARVWSVMKSATGSPGPTTTGGSMLSDEDWEDLKRCRYLRIVEEASTEDDIDDVFGSNAIERNIIN
ncbi:uncharacterized protein LOC117124344 [Anneissia japonica]|uniref:uncharacterized protein LOC117124344 n=1 Tax=Anneissia japonica TaxID=1529436 RepID=UPI001425A026|nr:uncharacterized protein LOC117124344 [Anneissia japonica]